MKDLSKVEGSTTSEFLKIKDAINSAKTAGEIFNLVKARFEETGKNSKGALKILERLEKSRTLVNSQFIVYDSILKGSNMGVIK